jgi:tRNA-specific adenosine deaminase 3
MVAIENVAQHQRLHKTDAYLLNNLDLYTLDEPCAMCAMALVHSRIRRVFYVRSTPFGALGSQYSVHTHTSLNHHFQVFQLVDTAQ